LTFNASNWFTPQTVTVTGVNDFVLDGNVAYTINSTIATNDANYTAIVPTPVSVTNVATFTLAGTANSSPGVLSQAVGVGGSIVLGNRNSDVTKGSNGADTISAFDGDDLVIGGDGNDSIDGGLGNDTLFGGKGSDTLIGSIGSDVIFYSAPDEGVDAISGFLVTEDKLAFFGQAFGLTPGALAASQFTTGTAATAIAHRFVYNAGQLFFDPDGSGALPQVPLASFVGTPLITNTNFVII
jgi:Ca2+-binding RTX toxin-like protein